MRFRSVGIAILAVLVPVLALASGRYDPRLRFQTIVTPRFDIHFHQGQEAQGRRLAMLAETIAADLAGTLGRPSGRVQVILVNQSDISNGWATPLPFNTIEISAAAPGGASLIGNTDDWLRMVFAHEYTHIVHLSRGQGWIGGLRRVLGRMPLLYPNLYLPAWQIEGLAVYQESALTGQGRVPDRNFRAIADVAASAGRFEPLDRTNGGLVDWPSGHTPYVYGAFFHEFLVARYGGASLRELTDATAGRVPYLGSRAFKKVFKRSLGDLWREFEADARPVMAGAGATVTRLTDHGFTVGGPRFGPDGTLYYSVVNPHGFPALLARGPGALVSRKVADRYLGARIGFAGAALVFDQMEIEHQVGLQADLYVMDGAGGGPERLTHGARAGDPDVSPDGRVIVCTIQRDDRRELATLLLAAASAPRAQPLPLVSEPGVHFSSPRWSPDGRAIATERVSLAGRSEIVLVDPASGRIVRTVASSHGSRSVSPAWLPDGRLLFSSDRDGDGFRIFVTDIDTRQTSRLEDAGTNAASPEPSRDGGTLVYVGYTPDGYDLFSLPLASARWTVVASDTVDSAAIMETPLVPATAAPAVYSPWRTIAPRFWTPTLESDEDELVVGAATGGTDALGRHAYAIEAGWSTARRRPDWQVAYAYDRWRPTLFANVADDTDPWRGGEVRTREANAGVLFPFRRVRWSQSLLGALHSSVDELTCGDTGNGPQATCESGDTVRVARRALRAGWLLNDSRSYGYSISREDGWNATVTTEFTREALGADDDGEAATLDVRGYLPVWPRHAVIAARVAGAAAWGDGRARRVFSASGNGPQVLAFDFGSDAVGLLRGLGEDEIVGPRAAVVNLDYRFPLTRIDRGLGTLPAFARVVHGAVFVDAGHAWVERFSRSDVTVSFGAELSLDAVVGYVLPLTFTAGGAWVSHDRGFVGFGRIGRAF
jgi:dipeptidyl aminopeptidase/acylaminoacyl peptidase